MPAFQLNQTTAALVSDSDPPMVSIVSFACPGIMVSGRDALRQLVAACNLALDGDAARTTKEPTHEQ